MSYFVEGTFLWTRHGEERWIIHVLKGKTEFEFFTDCYVC